METNRERRKRLNAACQSIEQIQPPRPDAGQPGSAALTWLLQLADFNQHARITAYINRQDWTGLRSYLKTTASPNVFEEWQARAYPPPPQILHGEHPKLTSGDYIRGRPLWKSIPVTLAELEAAAAAARQRDEELVPMPEEIFDPID